jgi:hypothetical protein
MDRRVFLARLAAIVAWPIIAHHRAGHAHGPSPSPSPSPSPTPAFGWGTAWGTMPWGG